MTDFQPVPAPFLLAGEVAALTAAMLWACSMSIYRAKGGDVAPYILNLFKNAIALGGMLLVAVVAGLPLSGPTETWLVLGASGLVGLALGDTLFFAALRRLGAQLTAASQCLSPPMTALIAALALGESLTTNEWIGMAIAWVGVTMAVWFSRDGNTAISGVSARTVMMGVLFALGSAACQGVGVVMQRQGFQSVGVLTGSMMRLWPAVIVLVVFQGVLWRRGVPTGWPADRRRVAWIGGAAFVGAFLGCLLMAAGAKYAKAGVAAMLASSHPLWVIPIAFWFLRERANAKVIAATLIAVGGIVVMLL